MYFDRRSRNYPIRIVSLLMGESAFPFSVIDLKNRGV